MRIRSVSPLIATIILIALTVAIGAIIVGWGRNYIQQQTSCLGVGFEILSLEFDGNNIKNITVLNTGSTNFTVGSTFVFIVENAGGQRVTDTRSITKSWGPGEIINFYATGSLNVSSIASNKPLKVWMFYSKCSDMPSNFYIIT